MVGSGVYLLILDGTILLLVINRSNYCTYLVPLCCWHFSNPLPLTDIPNSTFTLIIMAVVCSNWITSSVFVIILTRYFELALFCTHVLHITDLIVKIIKPFTWIHFIPMMLSLLYCRKIFVFIFSSLVRCTRIMAAMDQALDNNDRPSLCVWLSQRLSVALWLVKLVPKSRKSGRSQVPQFRWRLRCSQILRSEQ